MEDILNSRTKGLYPISIGTSLALECFFGTSEDKPLPKGETPPFRYYDCIIINIRTLIRNIVNTIPSSEHIKISKTSLYRTVLSEINLIHEIVLDQTKGTVFPTFYLHTYRKLGKVFKAMKSKEELTAKQKVVKDFEDDVANMIYALDKLPMSNVAMEKTDLHLKYGKRRNLILTHYPVDLLITKHNKLDLLESHTGAIKNSFVFNSKLKGKPESVPFNCYTIQIYGDTTGMFQPASTVIRKDISDMVAKKLINPLMSEDKFYKVVKANGSHETVSFIKSAV